MEGHRISLIFAKVIKDRRQEMNISLEDLAGKTGVDIKTIVQIENSDDVDNLPLWMYENLFNALEMDMEDIAKAYQKIVGLKIKKLVIRSRSDELLKEVNDFLKKSKRPLASQLIDSDEIARRIAELEGKLDNK